MTMNERVGAFATMMTSTTRILHHLMPWRMILFLIFFLLGGTWCVKFFLEAQNRGRKAGGKAGQTAHHRPKPTNALLLLGAGRASSQKPKKNTLTFYGEHSLTRPSDFLDLILPSFNHHK